MSEVKPNYYDYKKERPEIKPIKSGPKPFRPKNPDHILVSPSRRYVFFVEDALDELVGSNRQHIYRITVPDSLPNDEIEAADYFFQKYGSACKVSGVLTYEAYAESVLERLLEDPFVPKKADADTEEALENPEDVFISPSRTYMITVADATRSGENHIFKIVLPEDAEYTNSMPRAKDYFYGKYGHSMDIVQCEPYERYKKRISLNRPSLRSSPSRTYVLGVRDRENYNNVHLFKIRLPEEYPNNDFEARSYFWTVFDQDAKIASTAPIELSPWLSDYKFDNLLDYLNKKEGEMTKDKEDSITAVLVGLLKTEKNSDIKAYLDKLPLPALASLLREDIKDYLDKLELLREIKFSLARFYHKKPEDITDSELMGLLNEMGEANTIQARMLAKITRALKET